MFATGYGVKVNNAPTDLSELVRFVTAASQWIRADPVETRWLNHVLAGAKIQKFERNDFRFEANSDKKFYSVRNSFTRLRRSPRLFLEFFLHPTFKSRGFRTPSRIRSVPIASTYRYIYVRTCVSFTLRRRVLRALECFLRGENADIRYVRIVFDSEWGGGNALAESSTPRGRVARVCRRQKPHSEFRRTCPVARRRALVVREKAT